MSVFGTILDDSVVEDAVISSIKKWVDTYLLEVERQAGVAEGFYQRPFADASYRVAADFDHFPEEWLPVIEVVSPGIDEDPERDSRVYRARFNIGVTCYCSSTTNDNVRRYAYRLGAAIRALLIQNQSLDSGIGGRVRGIDFIGTRNAEVALDPGDDRTIWACRQLFVVEVGDFLTRKRAVVDPTPVPPDPIIIPDADHIHVDLIKEPVNS